MCSEHDTFFLSSATTCPYRLRGPPPDCGRSVTDFRGWGAHRAQLRCSDDVSDDIHMSVEYQEGP
jgi:hypothetical protein